MIGSLYIFYQADKKLMMLISYNFRYHPDKNANDPKAADILKEVTFSYNILSDPDKRHQYDTAGFEVNAHFCFSNFQSSICSNY